MIKVWTLIFAWLTIGPFLFLGCSGVVSIKPAEDPGTPADTGGSAAAPASEGGGGSAGGAAGAGDTAGGGSSTDADVGTGIAPAPQPGSSPASGQVPETLMLRGRIVSPAED